MSRSLVVWRDIHLLYGHAGVVAAPARRQIETDCGHGSVALEAWHADEMKPGSCWPLNAPSKRQSAKAAAHKHFRRVDVAATLK